MKTIKLTKGYYATIDDEDFSVVYGNKWQAHESHGHVYAERRILVGGKRKSQSMHRLLIGAAPDEQVDHKDGNGLNNSRSNLRTCTHAQNQWNRKKIKGTKTSRFYGVCRDIGRRNWRATLKVNGRFITIGRFAREEEAARAFDYAVRRYHGEFSRMNFPQEVER